MILDNEILNNITLIDTPVFEYSDEKIGAFMGLIKDISDNSVGKIIDTVTDVALEGLEKMSRAGFTISKII